MNTKVRVRFAPSPTGPLHIGGVRTALFNYLFAKKNNGDFILRIEDTDQNRYVEGAENYIINSLQWCGITIDEGPNKPGKYGPYKQSERKDIYKQYVDTLIKTNHAYIAFDDAETLNLERKKYEQKGETFIYNWHNRLQMTNALTLSANEVQQKIENGDPYVIRFKNPENETLHLKDIIRGTIKIDTKVLDDKILFKSDGMPTYHLANIVDDHLMKITHVIRGEEWLPSLALHKQLYDAFGWETPQFAHLPLILKPTGKGKLSKRDGEKLGFPVFPLQWEDPKTKTIAKGYKEDGYFNDALINFLAFLGWNPGTEQEVFDLPSLIATFDLNKVNKSGARFDPEKIKWFNHQYMQTKNDDLLAKAFKSSKIELQEIDTNYIAMSIALVKERATFISDLWPLTHYFFKAPTSFDEKATKKAWKEDTSTLIVELISQLENLDFENKTAIESNVKAWINSKNIGFGKVMMPLRLALVGALQGPDVYDIMFMIGKNETLSRLKTAVNKL